MDQGKKKVNQIRVLPSGVDPSGKKTYVMDDDQFNNMQFYTVQEAITRLREDGVIGSKKPC